MGVQEQQDLQPIFSEPAINDVLVNIKEAGNNLYIEWCGGQFVSQLTAWNTGLRLLNRCEGDWQDTTIYQPLWLDVFNDNDGDFVGWSQTIPDEFMELSEPFGRYRFPVLQLAARYSVVRDLLRSTPVLAVLWYDYCRDHQISVDRLVFEVGVGQRNLLKVMGLVGQKMTLKVLRKIDLKNINRHDCQRIRNFCKNAGLLRRVSHVEMINERYLLLLEKIPEFLGTKLASNLTKMESTREFLESCSIIRDCLLMAREETVHSLSRINNPNQVAMYHDRLVGRFNNAYRKRNDVDESLPFPSPPFERNKYIKPVENIGELRKIGQAMNHCVGGYGREIINGNYYVYQMSSPEKVTIGFKKKYNGLFRIDQVKGPKNSSPGNRAIEIIKQWLTVISVQ